MNLQLRIERHSLERLGKRLLSPATLLAITGKEDI